MVPYLTFLKVLKIIGFAKLPVLSVYPECVDYVPLHTLKEHPLWNVLKNDEYFRGPNLFSRKKIKESFFQAHCRLFID